MMYYMMFHLQLISVDIIIVIKLKSGISNTNTSIRLFDVNNDDIVDNLYCTLN